MSVTLCGIESLRSGHVKPDKEKPMEYDDTTVLVDGDELFVSQKVYDLLTAKLDACKERSEGPQETLMFCGYHVKARREKIRSVCGKLSAFIGRELEGLSETPGKEERV